MNEAGVLPAAGGYNGRYVDTGADLKFDAVIYKKPVSEYPSLSPVL